jgi:hypothetical protein
MDARRRRVRARKKMGCILIEGPLILPRVVG